MDGTGIVASRNGNFAIRSNLTSTDSDEIVGRGGGTDRNRERTALFATKATVYRHRRPRKDSR